MQVIDRHPGHSQSTGSTNSPVLLPSLAGGVSSGSPGTHTGGGSSRQRGCSLSPAEGTWTHELPRTQPHSSCWHHRSIGRQTDRNTHRVESPLLQSGWRWTLVSRQEDCDDQGQDNCTDQTLLMCQWTLLLPYCPSNSPNPLLFLIFASSLRIP